MTDDQIVSEKTYKIISEGPDRISLCVVPIELYARTISGEERRLGAATGYCENFLSNHYLITNWHCATGRNPATGQPKCQSGTIPSFIRVHLPFTRKDGERLLFNPFKKISLDLDITPDKWIMHQNGQAIDLAATLLDAKLTPHLMCMNDAIATFDPRVRIGNEVFVLGFPVDLMPTGTLPIWKRASVASEPKFGAFGEECFLIDSATREGMSGSPVIGYLVSDQAYPDMWWNSAEVSDNTTIGYQPSPSFLGVYSGRIGVRDLLEAQIGKVWRPETVQQMLGNPRSLDWHDPR